MLWKNIVRRIRALAVQLLQANAKGNSNTAKSSYYRAAIIFSCSITEGLVYQLVKKHTDNIGNILGESSSFKEKHRLPLALFRTSNQVYICEKIKSPIRITDNIDFAKLNLYLKNKQIITTSEYKQIERARRERNKIHLQSLSFDDTGYTKAKAIEMTKPIELLLRKL